MTIICWDGKTLAADKQASYGTTRGTVTKIQRVWIYEPGADEKQILMGGSGDFDQCGAMAEWVKDGRSPDKFPKRQADLDTFAPFLVIESDGTPSLYERTPYPIRFQQKHVAIGSGREYGLTAMHVGFDARQAVKIACELDTGCGNGIDALDFKFGELEFK